MNPSTPVAALLYEALTLAGQRPRLATQLARLRHYGEPLGSTTEILIEGFPRSGNSFAVAALCKAQARPVQIAHHLHAPGHVIAAVNANVPALVVIRHPDQAVPEFAVSKPNIPLPAILRGYLRFYEPLLPYAGGFVVATFEEVHADLGAVIRRINERFWTAFVEYEPAPSAERTAQRDVELARLRRQGSAPSILGRSAGQPENERESMRERARRAYERPSLDRPRGRARKLYEDFLAAARSHSPST